MTLGKPEKTALMAQSRSVPWPWTMSGRISFSFLRTARMQPLIAGAHPAELGHAQAVKIDVRREFFRRAHGALGARQNMNLNLG